MKRNITLLLFTLFFAFTVGAAVNVRVITPGGGSRVAAGEKFNIEAKFSGNASHTDLPDPPGCRVLYRSEDSYIVNGESSGSVALTLLAVSPGSYSYSAIVGGKKVSVKYQITAGSGHGANASAASSAPVNASAANHDINDTPKFIGKGNERMFLRASISKNSVYEQEALVYTIKLYTTYKYIKFLGATAAPKFDGFVVEEDKISSMQQSFEMYNGKAYATAVVARYVIFPQKPGTLSIKGNTYTVSADAFEYYEDPYFRNMAVKRPVQLNLTPNDLLVNVRALPSPRPADFSGGVGVFSISASLPSQSYKTNQISNVIYKVSGSGNIKYVKIPDLHSVYPSELEVFTPETTVDSRVAGSNVEGTATFSYTFMPMETGDFTLPPVKLVYFDPSKGEYVTVQSRGFNIQVEKGSGSEKSQTAKRFDSKLAGIDELSSEPAPWIYSFVYWLAYIIPTLIFIVVTASIFHYRVSRSDMENFRSRRAARFAARRLKKAADCMRRKDRSAFYDEILLALWGFLGDKLKMPTSELSRPNIAEVLTAHGISQEMVERTITMLDECEFAKYAPSASSSDMKTVYDKTADLIFSLNSDFSHKVVNDEKTDDEVF